MDFEDFIGRILASLALPLPGRNMQVAMSSIRRIREMMRLKDNRGARLSSVLILLYPGQENGEPSIVLIQRPKYEGVHGGQISLPGGRFEPGDDNLQATALRETREEIGMDTSSVQILGKLTELYIPPSNNLVQPYIGYIKYRPEFIADPKEVDDIIEIRIADLLNDSNRKRKKVRLRTGIQLLVPSFMIKGHIIWGATAMILNEFIAVVRRGFS
jgi:8-oxo-dGTP pyrophosphatase MutT (NUDIX family)